MNWPQRPTSRFRPTYRPCLLSFFVRPTPTWPISTAKFNSLHPRPGPQSLAFFASPRGGVGPTYLHKRCHSVIFAGRLAGLRGRGWVGRRLCRPPARGGGWMRAPARALAERGWGAFYESAEGTCGRLGDRSPTWGTPGEVWTERTRSLRVRMKLKRLTGERPSTVLAWHRVAEGNCVAVRRGGEQPEANLSSQSSQTRRLNPIRPIGVASLRRKGEALTCW